jgi:hypothetical protein
MRMREDVRVIRTATRRLAGPLALVSLVAIFLLPIWLGRSFVLRDMVVFHYPLKAYLRSRLAVGELALWNPYLGLGRPFLGVVQPAILYPLDIILLLPFPRGVDIYFALHALVAALGMRAWLRARGNDEVAAALGGALLALSGYYVSQLAGNGSYAVSVAWVPWAAWALARFVGDGAPKEQAGRATPTSAPPFAAFARAVALVAVFIALMLLSGDPQAAGFALAVLACEALTARRGLRLRTLAIIFVAALLGAAVAAAQLFPALEVAQLGRPGGVPLADAQHFSFPPARLVELVWPEAFGQPRSPDWLLGRFYDEGTGLEYEPWSTGIYLGLATPIFAAVAVARSRARRDLALLVLALVFLVVAFGAHTPIFALFFRLVPGAKQFRYPEKYFFGVTLGLCALAPAALDAIAARPRRALVAGGALLAILVAGWMAMKHAGGPFVAFLVERLGDTRAEDAGVHIYGRATHAVIIAALMLAPVALAARGILSASKLRVVLAVIIVGELFVHSRALLQTGPADVYRETPPPVAVARADGATGFVRFYRPRYNDYSTPDVADAAMKRGTLRPDCGIEDGVAQLDSYENFQLPGEQRLWQALARRPLKLLQVTGTRFILVGTSSFMQQKGLTMLHQWDTPDLVLGRVDHPAPRVYLARDAAFAADEDAAAGALAAEGFVPGESAILLKGDENADPSHFTPTQASGTCTLVSDRVEHLTITCDSDAPSFAVISDAFFPGWQARVDGKPAPIVRANLAMRAVAVAAGHHVVTLDYVPAHFHAGLVVSALGIFLVLALLMFARYKTRVSTTLASAARLPTVSTRSQ